MSYRCPTCERLIFNRRLQQCEFCGAVIPAELRFSAQEIAKLDRQMAQLAERRRQRDLEREEERQQEVRKRPRRRGILPSPREISEMVAKWKSNDAT